MRAWLISWALLGAVAMLPRTTHACSSVERAWVLPSPAEPVPTNTRIWFYSESYEDSYADPEDLGKAFSLVEEGSEKAQQVRVQAIALRGNDLDRRFVVVTPIDALKPRTTYRASSSHPAMAELRTVFTTGDGADHEPPTIPRELHRTENAKRGTSCGTFASVYVTYELDDLDNELLVAALDGFDTFDADTLRGSAHAVAFAGTSFRERPDHPEVAFGTGPFTGWPEDVKGRTARVRVGAFDIAGNFSGWSEPSAVTLPKVPSNCNMHAGRESLGTEGWILLSLSGGLATRRRFIR